MVCALVTFGENACGLRVSTPLQALRLEEDVDIKDNGTDGYYVGWAEAGEYLRCSVDVQTEGELINCTRVSNLNRSSSPRT